MTRTKIVYWDWTGIENWLKKNWNCWLGSKIRTNMTKIVHWDAKLEGHIWPKPAKTSDFYRMNQIIYKFNLPVVQYTRIYASSLLFAYVPIRYNQNKFKYHTGWKMNEKRIDFIYIYSNSTHKNKSEWMKWIKNCDKGKRIQKWMLNRVEVSAFHFVVFKQFSALALFFVHLVFMPLL